MHVFQEHVLWFVKNSAGISNAPYKWLAILYLLFVLFIVYLYNSVLHVEHMTNCPSGIVAVLCYVTERDSGMLMSKEMRWIISLG